jgi:hypothetical protein
VAGDIIEVSPGTYAEGIINKSIHLKGQTGQVIMLLSGHKLPPLPVTENSNIVTVTGAGISAEINDLAIAGQVHQVVEVLAIVFL